MLFFIQVMDFYHIGLLPSICGHLLCLQFPISLFQRNKDKWNRGHGEITPINISVRLHIVSSKIPITVRHHWRKILSICLKIKKASKIYTCTFVYYHDCALCFYKLNKKHTIKHMFTVQSAFRIWFIVWSC